MIPTSIEQFDLRQCLLAMNQQDVAVALTFVSATVANLDNVQVPGTDPNLLAFMFFASKGSKKSQIELAKFLTRLLANPDLLRQPRRKLGRKW